MLTERKSLSANYPKPDEAVTVVTALLPWSSTRFKGRKQVRETKGSSERSKTPLFETRKPSFYSQSSRKKDGKRCGGANQSQLLSGQLSCHSGRSLKATETAEGGKQASLDPDSGPPLHSWTVWLLSLLLWNQFEDLKQLEEAAAVTWGPRIVLLRHIFSSKEVFFTRAFNQVKTAASSCLKTLLYPDFSGVKNHVSAIICSSAVLQRNKAAGTSQTTRRNIYIWTDIMLDLPEGNHHRTVNRS